MLNIWKYFSKEAKIERLFLKKKSALINFMRDNKFDSLPRAENGILKDNVYGHWGPCAACGCKTDYGYFHKTSYESYERVTTPSLKSSKRIKVSSSRTWEFCPSCHEVAIHKTKEIEELAMNPEGLKIVEGIYGVCYYHLSKDSTGTHPICDDKLITIPTNINISHWGKKGHLNERYCEKCTKLKNDLDNR